eukprot:CAMPEP_0183765360 /NCGR_PEP_ID=MMETSP0739-20130205/10903_1 /TAXON_ID=385413 /ORGANISM="Thalassiosira miniscula, Strain CCMP1093" /LENGTH=32 /DNA_ID= /DNA_START= /DNA_END= /DNA_ORIENTATION=
MTKSRGWPGVPATAALRKKEDVKFLMPEEGGA